MADETLQTGPEFDRLSEDEIDDLPTLPRVIARCAPETKVRMVEALHRRNRLAVMTGDGVNDAPALKRADVGVGTYEFDCVHYDILTCITQLWVAAVMSPNRVEKLY